jgi:hypothetical protein
MTRRALQK